MLGEIKKERIKKLNKIKEAGLNPYPASVPKYEYIKETLANFSKLSKTEKSIYLVGRITSLRDQGGLIFADIYDGTDSVQVFINKKEVKDFPLWKDVLDLGDFIGVKGVLFKTKRGEKSIKASKIDMLTKSLLPLPDSWYGLKDVEDRFRKRYLDLILNDGVKESLEKRSEVVRVIREFLWKEGFMEVETPILQPIAGGAIAKPFKTHHNALGQDFFLRIAPELYLKRLLVGGFNKIFEMGRVFRNEGIDREHNPEFTMLELYWAYQDYEGLIKFTEKMLKPFIKEKWSRASYDDLFKKYAGKRLDQIKNKDEIDDIFKRKVRPNLKKPVVVVGYPKAISPLSKSNDKNSDITDRFQFIIDSSELVNGFSELNDPIDQRERMEHQEKLFRGGDEEASRMDKDFLEALEYGMPPAAGLGLGIDRLAAMVAGKSSLKESIIFPTLKKK